MQKNMTGLTEGPIWKKMLLFALPIFLGNVFQQFYNMVDSIIVGKFVGSKHYERMGLMECLNFQEDKIRRLESKIAKCYKKGKVVETPETMFYVDDRVEKDRLYKVLYGIFYIGCHRTKVRNIVKKLQLHSFLSEKVNISDVDSLIEIENYVYREFSDEFEKASGYRIK